MAKDALLDTFSTATHDLAEPLLSKCYFFHDIRIFCRTNHPAILAIFDKMLGIFPEPGKIAGESTYYVLCYARSSQFPMQVPRRRIRTETVRLLTGTRLKYSCSSDFTTQYQEYVALAPINEAALSVIHTTDGAAVTQIETPERYQAGFLRRYVLLLALGQLMHTYGFEPCHSGAITAPWDARQGALIIGGSGCGKTTLSTGCATMGCGLLGDDLVMLREDTADGTIAAYAISHEVSIRTASLDLLPKLSFLREAPADLRDKRYCTIEQVRTGATHTRTAIRLLLFPALTTETKSSITPLSKANTLQELVDKCMGKKNMSPQAEERLFLLLSTLAEQAAGYRLSIARGAVDGPEIVCSLFAGNAI